MQDLICAPLYHAQVPFCSVSTSVFQNYINQIIYINIFCFLLYHLPSILYFFCLFVGCRFLRMTPERFDHLHSLLQTKLDPKQRENGGKVRGCAPISSKEKLAITLRYLATGDSQQSESFNFRMGRSTVSRVIKVRQLHNY